jgi:hypothetical protein
MVSLAHIFPGGEGEGERGGVACHCPATEKSEKITRAEPFQFFILLRFTFFIYEKYCFRVVFLEGLVNNIFHVMCKNTKRTVVYAILAVAL